MMMTWEGMTITMMMMITPPRRKSTKRPNLEGDDGAPCPPKKSVFVSTDPQSIGRNVVEGCHH